MMLKKLLFSFFLLTSFMAQCQIFINELDSDTPSTDDKEFIELKSVTPNFPLDGYVIVLFNGTGTNADKSYYVIDLDGHITDINGIFVIGNQIVSPVPDKFLPESIFQNGPDGIGLYLGSSSDFPNLTTANSTNLIDALVYETSDVDASSLMSLLNVTNQIDENVNGLQTSQSIQRKPDGSYEAKTPTPGANNDGSGFIFNGILITVNSANKNEGASFAITFSTQTNVATDLSFTFTLNNGTFTTDDFSGNTTVFIAAGTNSFTTNITTIDDSLNEGDEVLNIKFGTLPLTFNRLNDNIAIRIVDNDFTTAAFGTPLNPTFGNVTSSAPSNYYTSLEGLSGAALKQGLQDIIANPDIVHAHNYGDIIEILKNADQNPLNSNQVWLMYVEQGRAKLDFQTSSSNVGSWNREHIYPQSRGGFANATSETPDGIAIWLPTNVDDIIAGHADAHHLRAEDGPENSTRSNKDYGLTGYNGPIGNQSSWKGDVARSVFYMAVRYNSLSVVNGDIADTTVGQLGDLSSLLQWNVSDPKDDFEMNRNNYIYTWQVNRNPFIDYPNLADYIWGANVGQPWYSSLSTPDWDTLKIVLYPNPTKDFLMISGLNSEGHFAVYSLLGAKLLETKFTGETRLNLNLSSGIYYAKITSENKTITRKIVIE